MKKLSLVLSMLLVSACAGTFEEARLVGLKSKPVGASSARTPEKEKYCQELDNSRISSGANAKGLGVVAGTAGGAGGITAAVLSAPKGVVITAAIVSVLAGAGAVQQLFTAEAKGVAWTRECGQ